MIAALIYFAVAVLVLLCVFWIIDYAVGQFAAPHRPIVRMVVGIVFLIILLLLALHFFGGVL